MFLPLKKLVGQAETTQVAGESSILETKEESTDAPGGEAEEVEEIPPRKRLRLEKKLRNAEFLFRRRKRDICAKMRQYESEINKTTRENNLLQQKVLLFFL